MPLAQEIETASQKIVKDGYDMSIGELISMYRDKALSIHPKFQRYFRWDISQKSKFIESLLLGIPIPPIFVYTIGKNWELVDGLQRLATILEFVGELRDHKDSKQEKVPPSVLEATKFLPSLEGRQWQSSSDDADDGFSEDQQFDLKRVRIRVEILGKASDPFAKFELFQRLNRNGSILSEQEMRSCVIIMINEDFHDWLLRLEQFPPFIETIDQTERSEKRQKPLEMLIRFIAFRNSVYQNRLDVHDFLDAATIELASRSDIDLEGEERVFKDTFTLLNGIFGGNAFKKWDGDKFTGPTSLAAYEFISYGLSLFLEQYLAMKDEDRDALLGSRIKDLWQDQTFRNNSKAGVRGTTRLANLLPLAKSYFRP